MTGKEKADPHFISDSSWLLALGGDADANHGYFFGSEHRESSLLNEFGWNIPVGSTSGGQIPGSDRTGPGDCVSAAGPSPPHSVDTGSTGVDPNPMAMSSPAPAISSSSSDDPPEKSTAATGDPPPDTASKQAKNKGQKRIRQQTFAFATKSEIDQLEDGYRWRKYGQKTVKNSPFPRSYYRCTNGKCMVKKRIERSCDDPLVVITTYEGQHSHYSAGYPCRSSLLISDHFHNPCRMLLPNSPLGSSTGITQLPPHTQDINKASETGECKTVEDLVSVSSQPLAGEGLLGDIVPPGMRNG